MATKTINQFGAVADILSSDFNFAAQPNAGGNNVKITKQQIKDYALSGLTTTAVSEGDNLYYTQARFDAALNAKKSAINGIVGLDASQNAIVPNFVYCGPLFECRATGVTDTQFRFITKNDTTPQLRGLYSRADYGQVLFNFSEDGPVDRVRFLDNGNVGLGIEPTQKLHVDGNTIITGTLNAGNTTLGTLSAGNSTLGTLGCGAITSTGNLSCSTLLTIESPAATNGTVQFKLLDEYHGLKAVPGTGLRMFSWKDNVATDFWFFNENTGNFGVGINPTEKLHVSGNGLITGTLNAGDSTLGIIACGAITSTGALTFVPDIEDRAEGTIGDGRLFFRVDQPNAKFYVKGKTAAGVVYNYDLTSGGSGSGDVTGGSTSIAGAIATYSSDTGKAIDYRDAARVYSSGGSRFTELYTDGTYGQLNSYIVADPNPTPADLRIQSHGGKTTFGRVGIDGHGWLDVFDEDGSAIEGSDFALQCYKNSTGLAGALALNPSGGALTVGAFGYLFEGVYTDFWHLAQNSSSYNGFIGYFGTAGSSITHYYNDNWNKIENNRNTAMIQVGPVFSTLASSDSFYGIGRAGVSESMDFRFYGSGKAEFRTLNSGSGTNLVISGTGELLEDTSSKRYKKDIRDYKNHEFIYDMQIKHYKRADCGMEQVGVIAEDFAELQKKHGDLSNYIIKKEVKKIREKGWEAGRTLKDNDYVIDGVAKQDFIFPVILALQEQHKEIEQLKQQLKKGDKNAA